MSNFIINNIKRFKNRSNKCIRKAVRISKKIYKKNG